MPRRRKRICRCWCAWKRSMCAAWRTWTKPTLQMWRRSTRLPSTSSSDTGFCTSWTPCSGRPTGRKILQMQSSISDAASSSTSTTTAGQPSSSHGATRSWVTACRISSRTGSGSSYRSFSGPTRCSLSCAARTTNTPQVRTTSCGRQAALAPHQQHQQRLPLPMGTQPDDLPGRPRRRQGRCRGGGGTPWPAGQGGLGHNLGPMFGRVEWWAPREGCPRCLEQYLQRRV
mmetsp:Transcript_28740/g.82222  ORF Transcript_28740/g.82222 Transcript_28740/m.82222 type:complete len:229 (-) Transcript_28740:24-710(-)